MPKSPLKAQSNNFNDHPHRTPTNSQTRSYPNITEQSYATPSVALKNETNDISGSQFLDYNLTGFKSNIYNEIPIGPPPGFEPLEEICINTNKNNSENFNDTICEELIQPPENINEEYKEIKQQINSEKSQHILIINSPPASFHDPHICYYDNNSQNPLSSENNYIPTSEDILEGKGITTTILKKQEKICVKLRKVCPLPHKKQKIKLPKQLYRETTIINLFRPDITTRQIRPTRMRIVRPNKLKDRNIPSKYELLNYLKQPPKENPSSQWLPLKATQIQENGNFTFKKLSTISSKINLFELQTMRHAVVDWKEILSMIDKNMAIIP